jgi:hypothetical protein
MQECGEFDQFFEPFWSLGVDEWMTFSIFLANLSLCLMKSHLNLLLAHICPNYNAFKRGLKYLYLKTLNPYKPCELSHAVAEHERWKKPEGVQ